jgi:hypothetical protein
MSFSGRSPRIVLLCLLVAVSAPAQQPETSNLVTTGQIEINGSQVPYRIRHLPPSSFPDFPVTVAGELTRRGCLIPQTYEAHRPENVLHASLEAAGSKDWAVLCSEKGTVSLLVFFGSRPGQPITLASALETDRLQAHPSSNVLGFNWGIDAASPQTVHEAQIGLSPRPPRPDHDALADSVIDHKTIYRYFNNGAWSLLDLPD